MTPAVMVRLALGAAALPLVLGAVAVRPADAQPVPVAYDSYSLTGLAAGVRTAGEVGAAGGLVTLDTGSGSVSARLDSAPSAFVLAAPYEPGTLVRTVVGQVNGGAGETVLDVPDAEAQFPGAESDSELETVPPAEGGPISSRGGTASASAGERRAAGTATGEQLLISDLVEVGASSSSVELVAAPDRGTTDAVGRTTVGRMLVGGVLELRDVVAVAQIQARGDEHVPTASLTIGGASVAGQSVALSDEGVTALGTSLVPGQTISDATAQANAALAAAGIEVRTVGTVEEATTRSATADTGGVAITVTSPGLPVGGVAGNELQVVVGAVVLTATDDLAVPALPDLPPLDPPSVDPGAAPGETTTFIPGQPGSPGTPGVAPADTGPLVAAPPATPASLVVAGRSLPAAAALAAFAVWQFLTLGTATLYALVDRRRRLAELAP
jgi:hypothetical protein